MKVGLLPLYIEIYDIYVESIRPRLDAFYETVANEFEKRGIAVIKSPFCRHKKEFEEATRTFERENVDAIVTLHMAYSPSLESIDALCDTNLPIIVLDTTETLEFTSTQDPSEISYCHGIHGVMDICSMFKRRGKPFAIATGHYLFSDCIDRAISYTKAACAANSLYGTRVGIVGDTFRGMGDFDVDYEELRETFGIEAFNVEDEDLKKFYDSINNLEIAAEKAENEMHYAFSGKIIDEEYNNNIRSCLAVRKYIEAERLSAFSVNFLNFNREGFPLTSMPFIEAYKAMERGIGYAGEGDALTSSFTSAFLKAYPETSFIEIFCPDWNNNMVFLSHMGEVNYRIADTKPCISRASAKFTQRDFPYIGYTRMKAGEGVYVNVSRDSDGYQILLAPSEMLPVDKDNFSTSMRGWMRPKTCASTAEFLEKLSKSGATHHSIFIYGADVSELEFFAKILRIKCVVI